MATTFDAIKPTEAGPAGPTFRLSPDQFQRLGREGIIPRDDRVELCDGYLHRIDAPADDPFYRLSVGQYRAIAEAGILTGDDRVELLEGWLVAKMGKNQPHVVSTALTFQAVSGLLPAGWFASKEDPVTGPDSEPEPDLMVVRGSIRDYLKRAPRADDVALVVEVAESSLANDRSIKKRLYARSLFPVYWLINLVAGRIEVYAEPTGPTEKPDYRHRQDFGPDDAIPLVIEGREVGRLAVRDLLP